MSRTKCALNGPVWTTPGTLAYQMAGTASMVKPLAAKLSPRSHAIKARMWILLPWSRRERRGGCDIAPCLGVALGFAGVETAPRGDTGWLTRGSEMIERLIRPAQRRR